MQKDVNFIAPGSMCFWSWNDLLEKDEIKRQMEEFSKGCFSGVIIHSRAGLRIPYMGKEWFEYYRFAIEQAQRLGLEIWIYDEDGWPSGFAGGKVSDLGEKYWAKKLTFSYKEDGIYENIIACWRKTNSGYRTVNKNEARVGDLLCCCEYVKNYVDVLSDKVVQAFIDSTHERYKAELGEYFGNVIKGMFTDEPQYMDMPWSNEMPLFWKKEYDSDLLEQLYMLYIDCEESRLFRTKYYALVGKLFYNSYTKNISDWCDANDLILTGHFAYEDGLVNQVTGNGGVMRHYKAMGMPGIDHLGDRTTSPVLCKQLSSVASQFSKPEVLSETFGCAGWQFSFEHLAWVWGRQSALGITKPSYHLAAYSITGRRKRDYPAFFSYNEPWWEEFAEMQSWINGLNTLMKEGKRVVDAIIISPLSSVAANYNSKKDEFISSQYRLLLENMLNIQFDFELGDETLISEYGRVENEKFIVGDVSYKLVIVPFAESFNKTTVKLLKKFSDYGGMIWYIGEQPKLIDYQEGNYPKGEIIQNRYQSLERAVDAFGFDRTVTVRNPKTNRIKNNTILHTRNINHGKRVHIWTDEEFSSGKSKVSFKVESSNYSIYSINPYDGSKERLSVCYNGSSLSVCIDICACDNIILELEAEKSNVTPCPMVSKEVKLIDSVDVSQCDTNVLTIDYAAFSFGDDIFDKNKAIVRNLQWLYEKVKENPSKQSMIIGIKYVFDCCKNVDFESITAVIENEFVKKIKVNGEEIDIKTSKWWVDRKFGEYYIGNLIRNGTNEIILYYEIPKVKNVTTTGFESDRNRFFLPVEPESIYIKGNFDVNTTGDVINNGNFYRISNGEFKIVPATERKMGDITSQNSWFYRGNLKYSFNVEYNKANERVFIKPDNPHGTAAIIKCCDKKVFVHNLNKAVDVTELLNIGVNHIEFLLLGSNRNLMGPHHHINGEVSMVGPSTFVGIKGFEDFVSPNIVKSDTWTDSYSFIPFGCDGFQITRKGKGNDN